MHKAFTVKEVVTETPQTYTLVLEGTMDYEPGQFVMLWIPGLDEKPFAIAYVNDDCIGITIEKKGECTTKGADLKPGDKVGVRGSYGHGFSVQDNCIVVGGGLGMATAYEILKQCKNSLLIQGARSKELLLYKESDQFQNMLKENGHKVIYCTDDGSFGEKGFTTQILDREISKDTPIVFTCGPEIMMKKVVEVCDSYSVNCEASLERMMKCGIGICASCVVNDQLCCRDGPVFNSEQLSKMSDFGHHALSKAGIKVSLEEFHHGR